MGRLPCLGDLLPLDRPRQVPKKLRGSRRVFLLSHPLSEVRNLNKEGKQHPDRDAQFRYIQRQGKSFLSRGWPVISVDTKKKELVGNYGKSEQEWQPEGQPVEVDVHDFPDPDVPKAVPRGVYDPELNLGWVTVGCSHDTASFAVESIRRWWREMGHPLYPQAKRVLI